MVCCLLSGEPTPLGVPFVVGWAAMTVVGAGCPWVGVTAVGVGCGGGALGGATAVGVVAPMSSTGSLGHVLTAFGGVGFNAIIQENIYMHDFECIVFCIKGYPPDAEKYKTFIAEAMSLQ